MPVAPNWRAGGGSSSPNLMANVARDKIYGTVVKASDGNGIFFEWNRSNQSVTTFDLSTIAGDPLDMPIRDPTDGHYQLPVGVDDDGVVHISGNQHDEDNAQNYAWWDPADGPFTTAANWQQDDNLFDSLASVDVGGYTYNFFTRDRNNTLLWFFSQSEESSGSPSGRDILAFKRVAGAWVPIVSDGHFHVNPGTPGDPNAGRAYAIGCYVSRNNRWWYCGHAREITDDADSNVDAFAIFSDDLGVTWKSLHSSGTPVTQTMPITQANMGNALITTSPTSMGKGNPGLGAPIDYSVGEDAFHVILADGIDANPYVARHCWWDGNSWEQETLANVSIQGQIIHCRGELLVAHHSQTSGAAHIPRYMLRRLSDSSQFAVGHQIRSASGFMNIEPIILREEDTACVLIPDGDTPMIYEYGSGARCHID